MKKVNKEILLRFVGPIIIIFIWFTVSHISPKARIYVATPEETTLALFSLLQSKGVFIDILSTLTRTLSSFILATSLGIFFGLFLGMYRKVQNAFEIIIEFFRSLPSTALLPLFILGFGINDLARIGTASFIGFWVMLISAIYGVTHASKIRVKAALSMKASTGQIFKEVIIWEALPHIFSGMRLTLSITLIIIIITEMVIGPQYGLGIRLFEMQQRFKTDYLYAVIITTGSLGFIINKILLLFESRIIHWSGK